MRSSISYVRKNFWEINISYNLKDRHICEFQRVRNISFSENFALVLNEWSLLLINTFSKDTTCIKSIPKKLAMSWFFNCILNAVPLSIFKNGVKRGGWGVAKHKRFSIGVFRTLSNSMEHFVKIVNGRKPLTIFAKHSILDV